MLPHRVSMEQYTLSFFLADGPFKLICYSTVVVLFITGICIATIAYNDGTGNMVRPEPANGTILCFFSIFFLGAIVYLQHVNGKLHLAIPSVRPKYQMPTRSTTNRDEDWE